VDLTKIFRNGQTSPNLKLIRFRWCFGSASGSRIKLNKIFYQCQIAQTSSAKYSAGIWQTLRKGVVFCALRVPF